MFRLISLSKNTLVKMDKMSEHIKSAFIIYQIITQQRKLMK